MIAQSVGCSLGCSHSQLGKPVNLLVSWCFRLRHGRLRAPIGSFSEGRGPWGARAVDQEASADVADAYDIRPAAVAARCLNELLSRRPSVSPLSSSAAGGSNPFGWI
jgi:hypothetical protein